MVRPRASCLTSWPICLWPSCGPPPTSTSTYSTLAKPIQSSRLEILRRCLAGGFPAGCCPTRHTTFPSFIMVKRLSHVHLMHLWPQPHRRLIGSALFAKRLLLGRPYCSCKGEYV